MVDKVQVDRPVWWWRSFREVGLYVIKFFCLKERERAHAYRCPNLNVAPEDNLVELATRLVLQVPLSHLINLYVIFYKM